jgi:hypothetical protein
MNEQNGSKERKTDDAEIRMALLEKRDITTMAGAKEDDRVW